MCDYGIEELVVGLALSDTPVGYAPPIGPSAKVSLTYNQREDSQPANFSYFNISPKWTLNWLSYIEDDPTSPGANVMRTLPGGGAFHYVARGHRELVTAVGHSAAIAGGEWVTASGEWVNDRTHGQQFKVALLAHLGADDHQRHREISRFRDDQRYRTPLCQETSERFWRTRV